VTTKRTRPQAFIRCFGPVLAAAMWANAASAHHSFALFDMSKLVTISGTVTSGSGRIHIPGFIWPFAKRMAPPSAGLSNAAVPT